MILSVAGLSLQIEELLAIISLFSVIIGAGLWLNTKQDNLENRFFQINTRHLKLRGSLSLYFQKISNQLRNLDCRISNLEAFLGTKGFECRRSEEKQENYGEAFWNESGLDDDTKIPEK